MSSTARQASARDDEPPRRSVPSLQDRSERWLKKLRVVGRMYAGQERLKPSVFIVGAQKAGTSSLFNYLMQHPLVLKPIEKEIHYFDLGYARGRRWYDAHFPAVAAAGPSAVTIDASPYYMFHPAAAGRLKAYAPKAKIVLLLREPVARAWSHYWHEWNKGYEPLEPLAALDAEAQRVPDPHGTVGASREARFNHHHFAYVARSEYAPQLRRWWSHFPQEKVLVLKSEDLFTNPQQVVDRATDFIGLPRLTDGRFRAENVGSYDGMPPLVGERLRERLGPATAEVQALLGGALAWT